MALASLCTLAACGSKEDLGSQSSALTTPRRVKDLQGSRFFRTNAANPTRAIDLGDRVLFFAKTRDTVTGDYWTDHDRTLYGRDRASGTLRSVARVHDEKGWRNDFVDADPMSGGVTYAGYHYVVHESVAGIRALVRMDGTAAPASVGPTNVNRLSMAIGAGSLLVAWTETTTPAVAHLAKLTRAADGSDALTSLKEVPYLGRDVWVAANDSSALAILGQDVFVSDGTTAGTIAVGAAADVGGPIATSSSLYFFQGGNLSQVVGPMSTPRTRGFGAVDGYPAVVGDKLFFVSDEKVTTLDATRGTTVAATHGFSRTSTPARWWRQPGEQVQLGDKWYFLAANGALLETDGSAAGTKLVTPDNTSDFLDRRVASDLVAHDGALYFVSTEADGRQLRRWQPGERVAKAVTSFPKGSETAIARLSSTRSGLFFSAGGTGSMTQDTEMWRYDGRSVEMVESLPDGNASSNPRPAGATATRFFFYTHDDTRGILAPSTTLWATDGTEANTVQLRSAATFQETVRVGSRLCFFFNPDGGLERTHLLCSDGTTSATTTFQLSLERSHWQPAELSIIGDSAYIFSFNAAGARALLRYNGRTGVRDEVATLPPGATITDAIARDADVVFFVASTDRSVQGIWVSDGTAAGTMRMVPNPALLERTDSWDDSCGVIVGRVGNTVYATRTPGNFPSFRFGTSELYKTDATTLGTSLVTSALPTKVYVRRVSRAIGSKLVFGGAEAGIIATDGTAAGTALIHDGSGSVLEPFGDKLLLGSTILINATATGTIPFPNSALQSTVISPLVNDEFLFARVATERLLYSVTPTSGPTELERFRDDASIKSLIDLAPHGVAWWSRSTTTNDATLTFSTGGAHTARDVLRVRACDPERNESWTPWAAVVGDSVYFQAADDHGDCELYAAPSRDLR